MCFKKLKALFCRWAQILAFEIDNSALKAPIATNEVFMSKLTIEEHFENDELLFKAHIARQNQISTRFAGTPVIGNLTFTLATLRLGFLA